MLSIAICDDQQDSLETIEEELHRSSKNLNVEIETIYIQTEMICLN